MRQFQLLIVTITAALLIGCQARYPHEPRVIGAVDYKETFGLPTMATLDLELQDLSAPDAPQIIAHQHITRRLRVPVPFSIRFDPKQIHPDHDYGVTARINVGTNIWFATSQPVRVITKGESQVQTVIVDYVKRP